MSKTREREEFVAVMTRECPEVRELVLLDALRRLMRLAARHGRLQEEACNHDMPEGYDAATEQRITNICAEIGCVPVFSGDPRGCTVKLKVPSGRTNDFCGTGICVPQ